MWLLLLLLHIFFTFLPFHPVTSKPVVRLVLKDGRGPCEGLPEVLYENEWRHVGDKHWNRSTEEVICRMTLCGKPVDNSTVDEPKRYEKTWLNELKCKGNEKDLLECDSPGLGISRHEWPTVKKIKCSNEVKISLEGFRCSGAVQYSINGESDKGYFCNDNWNDHEANLLCQSLACGGLKEIPPTGWVKAKNFQNSRKMTIDCSSIQNVTHLWQCAIGGSSPASKCLNPATVTCEGHERLRVKGSSSNVCSGKLEKRRNNKWVPVKSNRTSPDVMCRQMNCGSHGNVSGDRNNQQLTCADKVNVVLTDQNQESKCYGLVNIQVNGSYWPVCATNWDESEASIVCKELGCGKVSKTRKLNISPPRPGIMDNVECKDDDSSLWHCKAQHDKSLRCQSHAHIICSGSLDVKLEDGPGRCAGRLMIQHEGRWKSVLKNDWNEHYSNVICKQLNCGNKGETGKPGNLARIPGAVVTVICPIQSEKITNMFECDIQDTTSARRGDAKAVEITCEDHKVLFFKSAQSCYGEVGIAQGNKTYLLSGSDAMWNQDTANLVCQQMHCGEATSNTSNPSGDRSKDVWGEAYNCTSSQKSLFECNKMTPPSDHNHTIASVTCSGNRTVSLSNGCWGVVSVCAEGECGGVCGDTWTMEQSLMLCKSRGCGDNVLQAHSQPSSGKILLKALHMTDQTTDLSQSNFVKKDERDDSCEKNPAYVVCSGSVKPRFEMTRENCSGNLAVDYEGQPLPVCLNALTDIATQNVICKQLNCGQALRTLAFFGPPPISPSTSPVISSLKCSMDKSSSLSMCGIGSAKTTCPFGGLQCSDWKAMKFNQTCSGEVSVLWEGKERLVSSEGWGEKEGQRLCEDMNCGGYKLKKEIPLEIDNGKVSFWSRNFSCGDKQVTNIWECEKTTPPSQKKKLFIECQDESRVKLSEKCHGAVMIGNTPVCKHAWESRYSDMVCQEHGCGNALDTTQDSLNVPPNTFHVGCDKNHYQLGQCKRVEGKCNEKSLVTVYCVGNIEFRTAQRCGGVIEVKYQSDWKQVCMPTPLSKDMMDKLCEAMNCRPYNASIKTTKEKTRVNLEMSLLCTEETFGIKYCVKKQSCTDAFPAEIYCGGYIEKVEPKQEAKRSSVGLIVGGVFLAILMLVMLAVIFFIYWRRFYKVRALPRQQSKTDVSVKSGSFEDIATSANEMENFKNGRFRSESNSSYYDIDKADEVQPLNAARDVATAGSGNNLNSEDHVTYEVDDPLENYDDIDNGLAEAEVHHSSPPPPESDAAAAPED